MTKLLFLAGSTRKNSINKKLAKCAAQIAQKMGAQVTYVNLADFPLPIYGEDLQEEFGIPDNAKRLKKLFVESNGFFIASPEHNGSFPALLKNSLDWISLSESQGETPLAAFANKAAAISSTSPGSLGGLRGLISLRMFLSGVGIIVVPNQVAVPFAGKNFDNEGNLRDEKQKLMLESTIKQLIGVANSASA